nr:patatin-like phospholipase family protein [uncultured Cetobacterium sp.]
MKKKLLLPLFLLFNVFSFSEDNNVKINSVEDKIKTIEKQLEELKKQQAQLEALKVKFQNDALVLKNIEKHPPKIALVLSGGGAKGAAQIGVIEILEELKIPIDYVVGTSVGSIVGAMYSVGYTSNEIKNVVNNLDFVKLLLGDGTRSFQSITEKDSREKYPLTLSVDPRTFKISLPTGVTDGEEVYLQLKEIFSKAEGVHDFSKLPINFTAISTNLQTGEVVKIKNGDLALAAFKSMAIPTFLDPVEDKGKYYVDGGVVDNFAIKEAIDMGADIVIAVDISAEPSVIDNNSNIVTVLDKISSYRGAENVKKQIGYADILITPDVRKSGTLDFSNLDSLIALGREAGEQARDNLEVLSNEKKYEEIKSRKRALKPQYKKIEHIKVNSNNSFVANDIRKLEPPKEYLSQRDLNLWAQKIYALDYIDRVFYNVDEYTNTIDFNVVENFNSKLQGGITYISNYGAALQLSGTIPSFGKKKKKNVLKLEFSKYPKIAYQNTQLYSYFNNTFATYFEVGYSTNPLFLYREDKVNSTYMGETFGVNFYVGTSLFNDIFLGYNIGYKNTHVGYSEGERLSENKTNDLSLEASTDFITNTAFLYLDTLDSKVYPHNGISTFLGGFNGESLGEKDKKFSGYSYSLNYYKTFGEKLTLGATVNSGKIDREDYTPLLELFSLGGLRDMAQTRNYSFYGLPLMGIYTDKFLMGQGTLRYSLVGDLNFIFKYNVATLDSITTSKYSYGDDNIYGYGGGIAWDTFLGPFELIVSNNILGDGILFQAHIGYVF